jgi:hypothetical protein
MPALFVLRAPVGLQVAEGCAEAVDNQEAVVYALAAGGQVAEACVLAAAGAQVAEACVRAEVAVAQGAVEVDVDERKTKPCY